MMYWLLVHVLLCTCLLLTVLGTVYDEPEVDNSPPGKQC